MINSHTLPTTPRPRGHVVLAALIGAFVIINLIYVAVLRTPSQSIVPWSGLPNTDVIQVLPLGDQRAAVLTNDSRIIILEHGIPKAGKKLDGVFAVIAANANGTKIAGGTTNRDVVVWDANLNERSRFQVNGRVVDLRFDEEGKIVAGYGIGQFSNRFWVGRFDEEGNASYMKQVGFDVYGVETHGNQAYFALADGKLGALTKEGNELWRVALEFPARYLAVTADDQIVAADERGVVYLIAPSDGQILWRKDVTPYETRSISFDSGTEQILISDDDGSAYLLNTSGDVAYAFRPSDFPIRGFYRSGVSALSMLNSKGAGFALNLDVALGAARQQMIGILVLVANLPLVIGAIITATATFPRLRIPALHAWQQMRASRAGYTLILPSMLLILMFAYVPTVMGLYYSFTNFNLREPIKFIGLNNFVRLASDSFFWTGIGNMVLILVTSLVKTLTIPLLVAELVFWLRWKTLKYWMRVAFIIPSIVPGVVGVLLWKQIYDPNIGLLNETLSALGLGHLARGWLADADTAIWAIIFAGFPWVDTFAFLILLGGLLNINREIFDASAIDGASAWDRFFDIDIHLIRPQLRLILFFVFIGSVQGFAGIYIFTRGGPGTATYVPGLQMFAQITAAEFGYASAIGFALAAVILVVTVWRFRFNRTPEEA